MNPTTTPIELLSAIGIEAIKVAMSATPNSSGFLNFAYEWQVTEFTGQFVFYAETANVNTLYCYMYDAAHQLIPSPDSENGKFYMNTVYDIQSVVKYVTIYGSCQDLALQSTASLYRISDYMLDSLVGKMNRHTLFTDGKRFANIFVKELFIDPVCFAAINGQSDPDISLIYIQRESVSGSPVILLAQISSLNNIGHYQNRFESSDCYADVVRLQGYGVFNGMSCYMVVDWNSAWTVGEHEGFVVNNRMEYNAKINKNVASNIKFSPTIAMRGAIGQTLPSTQFSEMETQMRKINYFPISETPVMGTVCECDAPHNNRLLTPINIGTSINSNSCIYLKFDGGKYYCEDTFIDSSTNLNNKEIRIIGNGSTVIGASLPLQNGTIRDGYNVFNVSIDDIYNRILVDPDGNFLSDFYGQLHEATGRVEFLMPVNVWSDQATGDETEMRIPHDMGLLEVTNETYIQVYADYFSQIYKVTGSEQGYIRASTQSKDGNRAFVNLNHRNDYEDPEFMPCFRLINYPPECPAAYYKTENGIGKLFTMQHDVCISSSATFARATNSIGFFSMTGLVFKAFKSSATSSASTSALIDVNGSPSNLKICGCRFERIKSTILKANGCNDILFQDNVCLHYYHRAVDCDGCQNVHVKRNEFFDGNLRQNNDGAVHVMDSNYYVAHNKLTNYGYMGIGVGVQHNNVLNRSTGVVEYNELYSTSDYRNRLACVPLFDGGAIYTWTQHVETIIRFNFISGHSGAYANRGIYCDDGAHNVWIYENLIINTRNSFAIDLRYHVPHCATYNVNDRMLNNLIDGYYRFEGKAGTSSNIKGRNVVLAERVSPQEHIVCNYIAPKCYERDDVIIPCKIEEWSVAMPKRISRKLAQLHLPEFIRSHIRFTLF